MGRAERLGGRARAFCRQRPFGLQANLHYFTRVSNQNQRVVCFCAYAFGYPGSTMVDSGWLACWTCLKEKTFLSNRGSKLMRAFLPVLDVGL